jgi:hypothetical protein
MLLASYYSAHQDVAVANTIAIAIATKSSKIVSKVAFTVTQVTTVAIKTLEEMKNRNKKAEIRGDKTTGDLIKVRVD